MSDDFIEKWCVTCAGIFLISCKALCGGHFRAAQVFVITVFLFVRGLFLSEKIISTKLSDKAF